MFFIFSLDCGCDPRKTLDGICDSGNGVCKCKENYKGESCQECAEGYFGYPTCFGKFFALLKLFHFVFLIKFYINLSLDADH